MKTSWVSKDISVSFDKYNDMLENILGFEYIIKMIKTYSDITTILDFGCGPGKVSERIALLDKNYRVIAVDQSQNMLDIARQKRAHQNIAYYLSENDTLEFLTDNSVDCAVMCFVIINNESQQRIETFMKEIYRVLRPKGHCLILDSNPDSTGVNFTTFTNGVKGKKYAVGEKKEQYLKISDEPELILHDWFWTKENYEKWLYDAGFRDIKTFAYKISDLEESVQRCYMERYNVDKWMGEKECPPFIIYETSKV